MKKIIIVEDEFRIRNGLSTLINKLDMGCKVIGEAENGFEGLKMISDMEPEVVITDIKMPKMDGLSMIRQAKEMGASCDFVILSGYAEFEYAQQGIQLGVMDYLLKPASVSDVKELLNKLNEEKEITQGLDRENCSDIVREMINVIEESYGMKLQLDAIAEKFHMTPEYLGNLFAKETGIDALAISFGSSHGNYPEGYVPEFDFERLKEIKEKTKMPLVLHGGSGSGDENIKRCVEFGINKINVGCDFMNANVDSIKQHLKKDPDINYWVMMHQVEIDSQELVKKYIHLSGSEGKSL